MNVNSINGTNFQARLDISRMKSNKTRWQNIAKIFREETKHIPDETMKIVEHDIDTSITALTYEKFLELGALEAITFNSILENLLKKNSDDIVAKKLAKLLDIGMVAESRKNKAFDKFENLAAKQSWLPKDEFVEKRQIEYAAIEEAAINKANKDSFLKYFEILV